VLVIVLMMVEVVVIVVVASCVGAGVGVIDTGEQRQVLGKRVAEGPGTGVVGKGAGWVVV